MKVINVTDSLWPHLLLNNSLVQYLHFTLYFTHRMECNSLQSMWHQCLGEFYISNTTRQYKTQKTRSMLTFVAMNSYSCILGVFIQEVSAVKNKITKWLIRANDHNDIYFGWLDLLVAAQDKMEKSHVNDHSRPDGMNMLCIHYLHTRLLLHYTQSWISPTASSTYQQQPQPQDPV